MKCQCETSVFIFLAIVFNSVWFGSFWKNTKWSVSRQENVVGTLFFYWRTALSLALYQFCGAFRVIRTQAPESDATVGELRLQEDRQHDKFSFLVVFAVYSYYLQFALKPLTYA
jgi:hypothetical protein